MTIGVLISALVLLAVAGGVLWVLGVGGRM